MELAGLGLCGTGHAGQFLVQPEVVLQRDRGEGLVLVLDGDTFFGLDSLVQAVAPPTSLENSSGEVVDDLDLAAVDDVLVVANEQFFGAQGSAKLVYVVAADRVVQIVDVECCFDRVNSFFCRRNRALLFVDLVVQITLKTTHDRSKSVVELRRVGEATADDQRSARFVDEDRIDLVNDAEGDDHAGSGSRGSSPCCHASSRTRTRCWYRR